MALRRRPSFGLKETVSIRHFFTSTRGAHSEASPLLYSNNRFRFPDIFTSTPSATDSAHIAPFLSQIGSQASLVRHICIAFPTFDDYRRGRARLHEAHIKNLART
jgi:hypothetical protein